MNKDEENPSNLEGLGDFLPADVLKKLNELLEILHKQEHSKQGSTVINYYAEGSQHIDQQINIKTEPVAQQKTHPDPPSVGREMSCGALPAVLASPEGKALLEKAQAVGFVDAGYQPLISRTKAALLADAIARRLGIREKWKVFEGLWNRKNMYRDLYEALNQKQSLMFQDKLKDLLD